MKVPKTLKFDDRITRGRIKAPYIHKQGMAFVFLDTETKINFKSEKATDYLKLGVIARAFYDVNGELLQSEYLHFTTIEELHTILTNWLHMTGYMNLVAHNMSFDFQVSDLLTWLENTGYSCSLWYQEMSVTYIHWEKEKSHIRLLDNMNWWPMALKEVGSAIGEPKMEIDFEKCTDKELAEYCENDVRIMVKGMAVFWKIIMKLYGIRPRWTLGSTAMNCFLSTPARAKLIQNKLPDVGKDSIRSYVGGRVEVFRIGEFDSETLYKLDVNSLYPTVMAMFKYPKEYSFTMHNIELETLKTLSKVKTICANVDIKTKEPVFPVPYNGSKIYPTGTYTVWLTGNELLYAVNNNLITKCHKLHAWNNDYLFTDFVNNLYQLKQQYAKENNWGGREIVKRLLNSLYGKFAQLGYEREYIGIDSRVQYCRGKIVEENYEDNWEFEVLNWKKYRLNKNVILTHSIPIIASCVTANARQYMWQIFKEIGWENCYYSDTDSIITNKIGLDRVANRLDDTLLGALKNEGSSNYLQVLGRKSYVWGDKRTFKGVPYRAIEIEENKFVYTGFRTLNNMVFKPDNLLSFEMEKERRIRQLVPEGYKIIGSRVYSPVMYEGLI